MRQLDSAGVKKKEAVQDLIRNSLVLAELNLLTVDSPLLLRLMNEFVLVLELRTLSLDLDHLIQVRDFDWEGLGYGDHANRGGASMGACRPLAAS